MAWAWLIGHFGLVIGRWLWVGNNRIGRCGSVVMELRVEWGNFDGGLNWESKQ